MFLIKVAGFFLKLPAIFKGAKIGRGSFLGPGYDLLFVKLSGLVIGRDVLIGRRAWIQCGQHGKINIDDGTSIGRDCMISSVGEISIGKRCLFSFRTTILDHDHNFRTHDVLSAGLTKPLPIVIGDGCFVGSQSFILKGVTLGENCIVGANAVVTKSFSRDTIIGGNPAVAIGKRTYDDDR